MGQVVGGPVGVEVAGDDITVEQEGQAADAAPVEHLLLDVKEGLLVLGLVLADLQLVHVLGVLPHSAQREHASTNLAGCPAAVPCVVAEPELFQFIRMADHVLGETIPVNFI